MSISERTSPADVAVLTYSSRYEGGEVVPSRLSLLAFDAACYYAAQQQAATIVIAGEQSYPDHPTTGELLRVATPPEAPEVTVLTDHNRLLNTPVQVAKLVDYLGFSEADQPSLAVVCWSFHAPRVVDNFAAQAGHLQVEVVTTESIVDELWEQAALWDGDHAKMRHLFLERYGLLVDWPAVKAAALPAFERRERRTRLAHKVGNSGWLIKVLSGLRRAGRYDDITAEGQPITTTARR